MTESVHLIEALDARVERRSERREFFKTALGAAGSAASCTGWPSRCGTSPSAHGSIDAMVG